jgi:hypothetical protein
MMKYLIYTLYLLGFAVAGHSQQYKLSYDESTIPELYNTTSIVLLERSGNGYEKFRGKYRISSSEADLRGLQINYDPQQLAASGGKINFMVEVEGQRVPLSLQLPFLTDIRFNLYTDSIKPILNYYVNVEGVYSSNRVFPLTSDQVTLTSDNGTTQGMEWIAPKERNFDRVTFTATSRFNPSLWKSSTVYLKRFIDPRDAEGYEDGKVDVRDRRRR